MGFGFFFQVWVGSGLGNFFGFGSGSGWTKSLRSGRVFGYPIHHYIQQGFLFFPRQIFTTYLMILNTFAKKTYAANATVCLLYFDSKIQQIDEEKSSSSCIQLISPSTYIGLPDFWFLVSPLIQQFVLEIGSPN